MKRTMILAIVVRLAAGNMQAMEQVKLLTSDNQKIKLDASEDRIENKQRMPLSLQQLCAKKIAETLIMDDSMHALHAKPDDDFVKDVFSLPEHLRDIIQPYMPQHWAVSHTIRHDNWVWALAFSPNIELLATGSNDNNARIIKTGTGAVSHTIEHGDRVWAVAFSPKGELLATGSADGNARIINIATGEVLHTRW